MLLTPSATDAKRYTRQVSLRSDGHQQGPRDRAAEHLGLRASQRDAYERIFQDLHERYDHDDREDEDAQGFEPATADWEPLAQGAKAPVDELVCRPDDQHAKQVER